MTDAQIAEIYAIAREAFNGGERAIQMQSFPFHMTAENLAKHRLDPNIAFWKEIKNGADHFEVTKTEPDVLVCGKHYVFGAHSDQDVDASAPCPANLQRDDQVEAAVAEKEATDNAAVATLVAQGVKPVKIVYQDGGQNAAFAGREDLDPSAPEALAAGPTVITLDNSGRPLPAAVKVAATADVPAPAAAPAAASAPPPPRPFRLPPTRQAVRRSASSTQAGSSRSSASEAAARRRRNEGVRASAADPDRRAAAAQAQRRARRARAAGDARQPGLRRAFPNRRAAQS